MKIFRLFISMFFLVFLMFILGPEIFATGMEISAEGLSVDEKENIIANINLTAIDKETEKNSIKCFDVNDDGLIAIGSGGFEKKTINVYEKNGSFQYGYEFYCSGSFGIEWDSENLIIYFVRSDVAIIVDSTGKINNVFEIQNTVENNSYWNKVIFSTERIIGDSEYRIQNDMGFFNVFASSYSQLVVEKENGETDILYDVNTQQLFCTLLIFICILITIVVVIFMVVHQFVRLKRNKNNAGSYSYILNF